MKTNRKILLLSIKPKYSKAIFSGEKIVELRKQRMKIQPGDIALVYESSPTMSIVGCFTIGGIIFDSIDSLWEKTKRMAVIDHTEFYKYYTTKEFGYGIEILHAIKFRECIRLQQLRQKLKIQPPQSFRYLDSKLVARLEIKELKKYGLTNA